MIWCYACDFEPLNDGSDGEITPKDIRDAIFPKQVLSDISTMNSLF